MTLKFLVTGPMRSGTTYMASILNSQNDLVCIEDDPWSLFRGQCRTQEQFDCLCANVEAKFMYLGLPYPLLRGCSSPEQMLDYYCHHLLSIYGCTILGFKKTMIGLNEISARIREGYKVILMRRDSASVIHSWLHRIEPSLASAAYRLRSYLIDINSYNIDYPPGDLLIVDYESLRDYPDVVLTTVSEFLGYRVSLPSKRYHSFNKGRFEFDRNTSFFKDKNVAKSPFTTPRDMLPSAYSNDEISRYALFAQGGRGVNARNMEFYLNHPGYFVKASAKRSFAFAKSFVSLIR